MKTEETISKIMDERDRIQSQLAPHTEEEAHDLVMSYNQMYIKGKFDALELVIGLFLHDK